MAETYIYWISTALLSLLYLISAYTYVARGDWVRQVLSDLGYPAYLVPVMVVVKILGVVAILSRFSVSLSDLARLGGVTRRLRHSEPARHSPSSLLIVSTILTDPGNETIGAH